MLGSSPNSLRRRFAQDKVPLALLLPTLVLLLLFNYLPYFGLAISFQNYRIGMPIVGPRGLTEWVGLKHFRDFLGSIFFARVFGNTLRLSVESLVFGFWVPIVFAMLLNEVATVWYKKLVQTFVYLPYFISTVIVVAVMMSLTTTEGVVNQLMKLAGRAPVPFMQSSRHFDLLYVSSGIWHSFGYSSIIYLAVISSIDPNLYEAAVVDGANRFHKMIHVTLPGIMPTVVVLLILAVGNVLNANTEKILLMYNPSVIDRADVIGTYVYRVGLVNARYSYTAAVGLFSNVVNFVLVFGANIVSRRSTEYSLW